MAMLSGERGPSSKRGVMVWLLLLFTFMVVIDLFTGKHPQQIYTDQVFELLLVAMGIVFGEKFVTALTISRNQKLSNKQNGAFTDAAGNDIEKPKP